MQKNTGEMQEAVLIKNFTSGTENRVRSLSKKLPLYSLDNLLPNSDFAVPGGPMNKICSPLKAAKSINLTSVSRSTKPTCK